MDFANNINLLPNYNGLIHFVGIGGIGMSGIAEIFHNLGYKVQGSDISDNYVTERLKNLGIKIFNKQEANNLEQVSILVKSSAIKPNNPELIEANKKNIPIILRAQMLAELMRLKNSIAIAGTHGKTTTTSLIATLFSKAGYDPTIINGGILNDHGSNAKLGQGRWLVAEADESDGTFLKLPAVIGVVTNIDPEHMENYGTFDNLKNAFKQFILNLPFYGFAVLCKDHDIVKELAKSITERTIFTYGIDEKNVDIRAVNIRSLSYESIFDIEISTNLSSKYKQIKDIKLSTPGIHNVLNSLSAIAIALRLEFDEEAIKKGLCSFSGVKRRFTQTGIANGITFIDDYAHHPKEISATLKAARNIQDNNGGKVIAVLQPHRYTRLHDLFDDFCQCFGDANNIIVTPVYAAGEDPINGANHNNLASGIEKYTNHNNVSICESEDLLAGMIKNIANDGDMVIFLGAGSITKWAYDLPKKIVNM